jgi:hypothetical protein
MSVVETIRTVASDSREIKKGALAEGETLGTFHFSLLLRLSQKPVWIKRGGR